MSNAQPRAPGTDVRRIDQVVIDLVNELLAEGERLAAERVARARAAVFKLRHVAAPDLVPEPRPPLLT